MKQALAEWLRRWADRLDPPRAPEVPRRVELPGGLPEPRDLLDGRLPDLSGGWGPDDPEPVAWRGYL